MQVLVAEEVEELVLDERAGSVPPANSDAVRFDPLPGCRIVLVRRGAALIQLVPRWP